MTLPAAGSIIDPMLRAELDHRRDDVAAVDTRLLPQVDRLVEFVMNGGKRLRPQFLWCGWLAGGGAPDGPVAEAVWQAAAALELIQAGALVHDDIIDNSDTRRGENSVHVDVGVPVAILLGDLALAWADDMFSAAMLRLRAAPEVLAAWRQMRTEVMAGQLLDLWVTNDPTDDPIRQARDARRVNRFKTAAYTVERPLHLGAALAGAPAPVIGALRGFGAHVGIAFQLRDDLLGVFGDQAVTGKPAGDDLVEGKRTVLLAGARSRLLGDRQLLAELDAGIGRDLGAEHTARLASIIAGSGAVAAIEEEIDALLVSGLAALDQVQLPGDVNAALRALAVAATARTR